MKLETLPVFALLFITTLEALLSSQSLLVAARRYPKTAPATKSADVQGATPNIIPASPDDSSSSSFASKEPGKQKVYTELSDLMVDLAKRMCNRLGPIVSKKLQQLQQQKNKHQQGVTKEKQVFSYQSRCDVLYEALERIAGGMGDTMVNELDMTQQDLVDSAQTPQNYFSLVGNLKTAVKSILTMPAGQTISETDLDNELHRMLSEFILKSATQDPGHAEHMRNFARAANKNAQIAGIKMPTYGMDDVDELDEENFLVGQDLTHSQIQKADGVESKEITEEAPETTTEEEDEQMIDELSKETWLIDEVKDD